MKHGIMMCLLALVVAVPAFSAEKPAAKKAAPMIDASGGQGYGWGGCGLGSIIFGDQPGWIQFVAAFTNDIYSHQSFAITSGTSNCAPTAGGNQAALFITANREALEKDISRGNGEALVSLSQLMGCEANTFGAQLQKNYEVIFPTSKVSTDSVVESISSIGCGV